MRIGDVEWAVAEEQGELMEHLLCRNHDENEHAPGCAKIADPAWTMDFTDIEDGAHIYWCSVCGPGAHETNHLFTRALETRGAGFRRQAQRLIEEAELESEGN